MVSRPFYMELFCRKGNRLRKGTCSGSNSEQVARRGLESRFRLQGKALSTAAAAPLWVSELCLVGRGAQPGSLLVGRRGEHERGKMKPKTSLEKFKEMLDVLVKNSLLRGKSCSLLIGE